MKLVSIEQAASICGVAPHVLRYRVERGDLPVARRMPIRLRVTDVLTYAAALPPIRPYRRKNLTEIVETAATELLARVS
jgi:hypothetical protein